MGSSDDSVGHEPSAGVARLLVDLGFEVARECLSFFYSTSSEAPINSS